MRKYSVAVVGATGNVGRMILNILEERNFPYSSLYALASAKSKGRVLQFGDNKSILVENLWDFDFKKADIVLSSPGSKVSANYVPSATEAGSIVIDNTSCFRSDPQIPLVVPEVNPKEVVNYKNKNIIANPNCSTIQMLVALKPIHDIFNIKKIIVSTYQAVSGAGKNMTDNLTQQSLHRLNNGNQPLNVDTDVQIAFNAIPCIDVFMDDASTKEERKIVSETHKILSPDIKVHANCARIPVFNGHSEYINIETQEKIEVQKVKEIWEDSCGLRVIANSHEYATPLGVNGQNDVFISRIRRDCTVKNGISFWCVADNLRKGAALNTVQIAEELLVYLSPKANITI